jgi:hypothetical protein
VSFDAKALCVASARVFIVVGVYFVMTESGNFWIHSRIHQTMASIEHNIRIINQSLSHTFREHEVREHPIGSGNGTLTAAWKWANATNYQIGLISYLHHIQGIVTGLCLCKALSL